MKRIIDYSLVLIFVSVNTLSGLELRSADVVEIAADAVINDDLIAFGRQVNIRGRIAGDVIAFAQMVNIEGEIGGTVIAGASIVNLSVKSCRSAWLGGSTVQLTGAIAHNALIFGQTLFADKNAQIGNDLIAFGKQFNMSGEARGQVKGGVAEFFMIGKAGSVDINADQTQVTPTAEISGDFIVRGDNEPKIGPGAKIGGETRFVKGEAPVKKSGRPGFPLFRVYLLFASLVAGVAVILSSARQTRRIMATLVKSPWKTIGFGFVCVFAVPVAVIFVIAMLVTIPVALYAIFMYLTVLYLASVFAGLAVGEQILRLFKKEGTVSLYLSLLVGSVILFITGFVPVLGFIVGGAALIAGSGMIVTGQMGFIREAKQQELL